MYLLFASLAPLHLEIKNFFCLFLKKNMASRTAKSIFEHAVLFALRIVYAKR